MRRFLCSLLCLALVTPALADPASPAVVNSATAIVPPTPAPPPPAQPASEPVCDFPAKILLAIDQPTLQMLLSWAGGHDYSAKTRDRFSDSLGAQVGALEAKSCKPPKK